MRGITKPLGTQSMVLVDHTDLITRIKTLLGRARTWLKHKACIWIHGGHELYRARTDKRLFQQCLLCGYETAGWTIDRRDRRLHLVSADETATASRTRR